MMTQANREVEPCLNPSASTMPLRLRDFIKINPSMFFGSKVNKDPQDFKDEIYKIVHAAGVTSNEKVELVAYQLKDVSQSWYTQWKDNRSIRAGPIIWEVFRNTFLDRFFPREKRRAKV